MPDLTARHQMVETQIARRGVRNPHVLQAMRKVPRGAFVARGFEEFAYEDGPLPIGYGQTRRSRATCSPPRSARSRPAQSSTR